MQTEGGILMANKETLREIINKGKKPIAAAMAAGALMFGATGCSDTKAESMPTEPTATAPATPGETASEPEYAPRPPTNGETDNTQIDPVIPELAQYIREMGSCDKASIYETLTKEEQGWVGQDVYRMKNAGFTSDTYVVGYDTTPGFDGNTNRTYICTNYMSSDGSAVLAVRSTDPADPDKTANERWMVYVPDAVDTCAWQVTGPMKRYAFEDSKIGKTTIEKRKNERLQA